MNLPPAACLFTVPLREIHDHVVQQPAEHSVTGCRVEHSKIRDGVLRIEFIADSGELSTQLGAAFKAAAACFEAAGCARLDGSGTRSNTLASLRLPNGNP